MSWWRTPGETAGKLNAEMLDMFPLLVAAIAPGWTSLRRSAAAIGHRPSLDNQPRILILDEPTDGIQPFVVVEIEQTILSLTSREGLSILLWNSTSGSPSPQRAATTS